MKVSDDKEYYPLVAVAAVDMCGMKKLLDEEDNCSSAWKALTWLIRNASVNEFYSDKSLKNKAGTMYELGTYFGDSVYIFADTSLDIGIQVDRLAVKCASLIGVGFDFGFLVRAGIAVGDLRRKVISLYGDKQQEVRIGRGMAKAHMLQECQDWIGGAVESEFPPAPEQINRIEYDVPIKEKTDFSNSKLEAVNWVYILASRHGNKKDEVLDVVSKSILKLNGLESEKIRSKLENTIGFIEYVFSQSKYIM